MKHKAPGHIVGIVLDQGLLDLKIERLQRQPAGRAGLIDLLQVRGNFASNPRHEFAILSRENLGLTLIRLTLIRLTLHQDQAGKRPADRIGHLGEGQVPLPLGSREAHGAPGTKRLSFIQSLPPIKSRRLAPEICWNV